MTTLRTLLQRLGRTGAHEEQPHFHASGTHGEPAVCFDAHCQNPHLSV